MRQDLYQPEEPTADPATTAPELHLKSFTYQNRVNVLPALSNAIDNAGGWVLERHSTSPDAVEVNLETQTAALPDIYAALLESGLELTRDSHRALAQSCNCSLHLRPRPGVSTFIALRLDVQFLPDPQPLDHSHLLRGPAAA